MVVRPVDPQRVIADQLRADGTQGCGKIARGGSEAAASFWPAPRGRSCTGHTGTGSAGRTAGRPTRVPSAHSTSSFSSFFRFSRFGVIAASTGSTIPALPPADEPDQRAEGPDEQGGSGRAAFEHGRAIQPLSAAVAMEILIRPGRPPTHVVHPPETHDWSFLRNRSCTIFGFNPLRALHDHPDQRPQRRLLAGFEVLQRLGVLRRSARRWRRRSAPVSLDLDQAQLRGDLLRRRRRARPACRRSARRCSAAILFCVDQRRDFGERARGGCRASSSGTPCSLPSCRPCERIRFATRFGCRPRRSPARRNRPVARSPARMRRVRRGQAQRLDVALAPRRRQLADLRLQLVSHASSPPPAPDPDRGNSGSRAPLPCRAGGTWTRVGSSQP